jgi:hypothetical protein
MGICVPAILEADFTEPKGGADEKVRPSAGGRIPMSFKLEGDKRKPEDRKAACLNWILSKGFQEFARAVRHSLEEAHVYVAMVEHASSRDAITWGDFEAAIAPARKQARKMISLTSWRQ